MVVTNLMKLEGSAVRTTSDGRLMAILLNLDTNEYIGYAPSKTAKNHTSQGDIVLAITNDSWIMAIHLRDVLPIKPRKDSARSVVVKNRGSIEDCVLSTKSLRENTELILDMALRATSAEPSTIRGPWEEKPQWITSFQAIAI